MQNIELAKSCLAGDLLGPLELKAIAHDLGMAVVSDAPAFPEAFLKPIFAEPGAFLALLGVHELRSGAPANLLAFRERFGIDPAQAEPCFYNQDWYLNEGFARDQALEPRWYLLRKGLLESSRGKNPDNPGCDVTGTATLPSALLCAYAFFAYYFHSGGTRLWDHDYVWCSDLDHQGDRIYVGRYTDPAGVQKQGFSVHRHLRIRRNYGLAEVFA